MGMDLVIKFGGKSIRDGERIENAVNLAAKRHSKGDKLVIVNSALDDMTDRLIEVARRLVDSTSRSERLISNFLDRVSEMHLEACRTSLKGEDQLSQVTDEIRSELTELEKVLSNIAQRDELTPRQLDLVMSFGERLATPLLAGALRGRGIPSRHLTGIEAGIITDGRHLRARPKLNRSLKLLSQRLGGLLKKGMVPVVTGFIAGTEDGAITTLGRGGSDFSASIIGSALKVDEIWIMTDVDGIMTADPRIEPEARTVDKISYREATELAYFGARVLHPKSIEPAMEQDIPVRVRNTLNPENLGTLIVQGSERIERVVKAITASRNVAIVTVGGPSMVEKPGVTAKVFNILEKADVGVLMISQSSSQANVSFIVKREDLGQTLDVLRSEFSKRQIDWNIEYDERASVIATVGAGMKGTPGVAARVFKTMGQNDINILMIAQGSSELNISFAVGEKDAIEAVRSLHSEFDLSEDER